MNENNDIDQPTSRLIHGPAILTITVFPQPNNLSPGADKNRKKTANYSCLQVLESAPHRIKQVG